MSHDAEAFWNARYAGDAYHFGEVANAFLMRQADRLRPGMRALAVADGEGRNGVWLAEQGLEVTSADISPRAVEKARKLAARRGVALNAVVADLDGWTWPEASCDVVVAIFIQFADPAFRAWLFDKMARALRPGGLLLLEGYRPEQLDYGTGGPSEIGHLYTATLLSRAFAGMDIEVLDSYDAEIEEGPGHAGLSALIDLVAVRR